STASATPTSPPPAASSTRSSPPCWPPWAWRSPTGSPPPDATSIRLNSTDAPSSARRGGIGEDWGMRLHVPMAGRDPGETHRASTPLELFFDLTFVVAVSQAAAALHHGLVDGHAGGALAGFPLVFFAIWWAWMQFTWFASAYDTDDVPYRLAVLLQLTGVLVLAAGVPRALNDRDFGITTLGYVMMRLAIVGQWLRAAASHPD